MLGGDARGETVLGEKGVHVGRFRADVLSGVINSAEARDEAAVGTEKLETLGGGLGAVGFVVERLAGIFLIIASFSRALFVAE